MRDRHKAAKHSAASWLRVSFAGWFAAKCNNQTSLLLVRLNDLVSVAIDGISGFFSFHHTDNVFPIALVMLLHVKNMRPLAGKRFVIAKIIAIPAVLVAPIRLQVVAFNEILRRELAQTATEVFLN